MSDILPAPETPTARNITLNTCMGTPRGSPIDIVDTCVTSCYRMRKPPRRTWNLDCCPKVMGVGQQLRGDHLQLKQNHQDAHTQLEYRQARQHAHAKIKARISKVAQLSPPLSRPSFARVSLALRSWTPAASHPTIPLSHTVAPSRLNPPLSRPSLPSVSPKQM